MSQRDDAPPTDPRNLRRPWTEGPDEEAPDESWMSLGDDELLHRIEGHDSEPCSDDILVEIVQSDRHFFIRQEAAKKVQDRSVLFPFEDDRHIGQILVRYLTRREDVTYLERLVARSRHAEVRAAAQVQLAQLWGRLGGPTGTGPEGQDAPPPPEFAKPVEEAPSSEEVPSSDEEIEIEVDAEEPGPAGLAEGSELAAAVEAAVADEAAPGKEESPEPQDPPAGDDGVDGSLLGWGVHFVVEQVWPYLDTRAARGLLLRTHAELLPFQPALAFFRVEDDAHVHVDLTGGTRIPVDAVAATATWMSAFLAATRASVPDMGEIDVRQSTRLMADALEEVGFYEAFQSADEA